jgi:hypothetical protein
MIRSSHGIDRSSRVDQVTCASSSRTKGSWYPRRGVCVGEEVAAYAGGSDPWEGEARRR